MSEAKTEEEQESSEEESRKRAHARAWELARRQGVKPIKTIKELQSDFYEFLELVRSIRHQDKLSSRTSE
jgi:hypothetical protein